MKCLFSRVFSYIIYIRHFRHSRHSTVPCKDFILNASPFEVVKLHSVSQLQHLNAFVVVLKLAGECVHAWLSDFLFVEFLNARFFE